MLFPSQPSDQKLSRSEFSMEFKLDGTQRLPSVSSLDFTRGFNSMEFGFGSIGDNLDPNFFRGRSRDQSMEFNLNSNKSFGSIPRETSSIDFFKNSRFPRDSSSEFASLNLALPDRTGGQPLQGMNDFESMFSPMQSHNFPSSASNMVSSTPPGGGGLPSTFSIDQSMSLTNMLPSTLSRTNLNSAGDEMRDTNN